MSYQIWVAKNTMIQICHWISKFTCKSDNYTHSDTSILFHCQCPQLRSVYLKGRSLRRQNWLNWMECFSGLPNLPHSQVLLFEIKILIQEAGLPPDWPNSRHIYKHKFYHCNIAVLTLIGWNPSPDHFRGAIYQRTIYCCDVCYRWCKCMAIWHFLTTTLGVV